MIPEVGQLLQFEEDQFILVKDSGSYNKGFLCWFFEKGSSFKVSDRIQISTTRNGYCYLNTNFLRRHCTKIKDKVSVQAIQVLYGKGDR